MSLARLLRGSVVSAHFWAMRFSLGTVRSCGAQFLRGFHIKRLARLVRTMRGIPRVLARSGLSRGSQPSAHSPSTRWQSHSTVRTVRSVHTRCSAFMAHSGASRFHRKRFTRCIRGMLHLSVHSIHARYPVRSGSLGAGAAFSPVRFTLVGRGILSCGSLHSHAVCRCQRFPWVMRGFRS